ncbi:hypothetical protein [Halolamina sp. C58]|jgi:hypothetical protein
MSTATKIVTSTVGLSALLAFAFVFQIVLSA